MPKVTFVFRGEERSGDFDATTSLLSAAIQLGVPIVHTCGGQPSCTDCRIKVLEGMGNITKPEFEEVNLMGSVSHITGVRLACQSKPQGDVRVEPQRLQGDYDAQARAEKMRRRQDRYADEKRQRDQDYHRDKAVREARTMLEERNRQPRRQEPNRNRGPQNRGPSQNPAGQNTPGRRDGAPPRDQRPMNSRPAQTGGGQPPPVGGQRDQRPRDPARGHDNNNNNRRNFGGRNPRRGR